MDPIEEEQLLAKLKEATEAYGERTEPLIVLKDGSVMKYTPEQERFDILWQKCRDGTSTHEENLEMLRMQEEYWSRREASYHPEPHVVFTEQQKKWFQDNLL